MLDTNKEKGTVWQFYEKIMNQDSLKQATLKVWFN